MRPPAPQKIEFPEVVLEMRAGETRKVICRLDPPGAEGELEWRAESPGILEVQSGRVKALHKGQTRLVVSFPSGRDLKIFCLVVVKG